MSEQADPTAVLPEPTVAPSLKETLLAIEKSMTREPLDRVKCVHVFDNYFRCNWWAPPPAELNRSSFHWNTSATHRVRKSRFLKVTNVDKQLKIEEMG